MVNLLSLYGSTITGEALVLKLVLFKAISVEISTRGSRKRTKPISMGFWYVVDMGEKQCCMKTNFKKIA